MGSARLAPANLSDSSTTMAHRHTNAAAAVLVFWLGLAPHRLLAQGAMHFQALAIPPSSVGTCASRRVPGNAGTPPIAEHRLVIASRAPSRRREIIVSVDTARHTIRYAEMGNVSTGLLSSDGDAVVAIVDSANAVHGFRIHNTVRTSDPAVGRSDTAARPSSKERAQVQSSHEPLDAREQRRVKELVALVRKRCPI